MEMGANITMSIPENKIIVVLVWEAGGWNKGAGTAKRYGGIWCLLPF